MWTPGGYVRRWLGGEPTTKNGKRRMAALPGALPAGICATASRRHHGGHRFSSRHEDGIFSAVVTRSWSFRFPLVLSESCAKARPKRAMGLHPGKSPAHLQNGARGPGRIDRLPVKPMAEQLAHADAHAANVLRALESTWSDDRMTPMNTRPRDVGTRASRPPCWNNDRCWNRPRGQCGETARCPPG